MAYEKRIRYLEYWENGNRIRSVGFVKIEMKDDLCNVHLRINGISVMGNCVREAHVIGNGKEAVIGTIEFLGGNGSLELKRVSSHRLCENISYEELKEFRISLGKNKEIICRWREEEDLETIEEQQIKDSEAIEEHRPEESEAAVNHLMEESEALKEVLIEEPSKTMEEPEHIENGVKELKFPAPYNLQEDKWKQLQSIYPHIAPFHDERDYLTIGPQDFVILERKYYPLITNSFMLHGYYNYGHIILTKQVQDNEDKFYLGVPGNFYEKERRAAIMFGFESFECKKEPVQMGDYGYFLIHVEL